MASVEIDLDELSKRLASARCWRNERGCLGTKFTKWSDLDPADVSLAARVLHSLAKKTESTP